MRLKELRKERKWTQQRLADEIGVSRSTVAMWETNYNEPDLEMLKKLSLLFNCSVDYLLSKNEQRVDEDLLDAVNFVPNELLEAKGNVYDAYRHMGIRSISDLHRQRVPMIGNVAAGEPIYDPEELGVYVDSPIEADAAITIRGDSMSPTYQDGDVVYIKCQPDVPEGAVAVVFLDDEAAIKHVYKRPTGLTLISDNPAYPPIMAEFSDYTNIRVFGVPVGFTRIFKKDPLKGITKGFKKEV